MRVLVRALVVVAAVVFGLVGLVVLSVAVDMVAGRGRLDAMVNTEIPNASGPAVRAYVARPRGAGPFPAVIMAHEFWGLKPDIVEKAGALAEEGYVVVAPDLFRGSTTSWIPRAIFQAVTTPGERVEADLDAVYAWLAQEPGVRAERVGIVGFCYGGRTALQYSLANSRLAATAVFYGSPITDVARLRGLPGPVLGVFGGADGSIPVATVRQFEAALTEAGVKHEIKVYDGQPHAFVKGMDEIRRGGAQGEAWQQLLGFFRGTLQGQAAAPRSAAAILFGEGPSLGYWLRLARAHAIHGH